MIRIVAAILPSLLVLQGVAPPRDSASAAPKTGTGVITGRVLAGKTDTGIASATVYLMVPEATTMPRAVLTDRAGRYTIDKLAPGQYRVSAMPPDHTARFVPMDTASPRVDLQNDATVTVPDLRLPFAAAVSGRIVDEHGEPLANIEVFAMGQRFGVTKVQRVGQGIQARTDDQGRFRVFGLSAGDVILVAEAGQGFSGMDAADRAGGFVTTYYPDAISDSEARRITLREGSDLEGIEIRMTRMRTFRISGTIVDSRGLPDGAAQAGLHHFANGSGGTTQINVAPDGKFEMHGVVPGSYRIVIGTMNFGSFGATKTTEYATVPVEVSDSNIDDLVITTKPGTDLTVRVVFESDAPHPPPPSFGLVGWTPLSLGFSPPQAEMGPDSIVVLKRAIGPVVLRPMSGPVKSEWFLKGVYLGDRDITNTPTEFTPADATRVRVVFTDRGATITGSVSEDSGKPVKEFAIVLFPEDRAEWIEQASGVMEAAPEKSGGYRLAGVRAGRYRIAAIDRRRANQFYFDQPLMFAALAKDATAITVTENEQRVVDLILRADEKK